MLERYGRVLLVNVLPILFHDGGFVHLNFFDIYVNHTVPHQSEGLYVPWISDFLQVLTQLPFLDQKHDQAKVPIHYYDFFVDANCQILLIVIVR